MIEAKFTRNAIGALTEVLVTGHAGSGPYGYDIVCASVSTLAINFINSLESLLGVKVTYKIDEKKGGYLQVILNDLPSTTDQEKVQLLFESFLLGMTNLGDNATEFIQTQVIE